MIIELGNHASANRGVDDAPKVTTFHIPEADKKGLGGYTHVPGKISVDEFKQHRQEAVDYRGGLTRLPDHEALLAVVSGWSSQSNAAPEWVKVTPHSAGLGLKDAGDDIERFLQEYYRVDKPMPADVEARYHTRYGPPGVGPIPGEVVLPDITNGLTNNGRVMANLNDGGGQTGLIGAGTAATGSTLTTNLTLVTNAWAGYRVYCYSTTANNIVWMNVTSNTNAAGASVLTGDRWYNAATPGGAAGTTPTTPWAFVLTDGGGTSAWFMGLATGVNARADADTTLATSGNVEYVTAGGGYIRKIVAYTQTSGVASRALTLVGVFTGNGSDSYPQTFTMMGLFNSMTVGFTPAMKYETLLTPASATVAASGDQVTVTDTITGS